MEKLSPNVPCPCGTGKKYKKCCLEKDREKERKINQVHPPAAPPILEEEWEDDDYSREESGEFAISSDLDGLPELSPREKEIIENWWEEIEPIYKKNEADEMIRQVNLFLDSYPDLFIYLELHYEFLFEMGEELARRRQWGRYAELLRRIKREQPEVYLLSFAYFDFTLISELIISGQDEKISEHLSDFKKYSVEEADQADKLVNLLAWTGKDNTLFELCDEIALPVFESEEVIGGEFAADWVAFREYIPYLERRGDVREDVDKLLGILKGLPFELVISRELLTDQIHAYHSESRTRAIENLIDSEDRATFFNHLFWRFSCYLREKEGFSPVQAHFLGDQVLHYWKSRPPEKLKGDPFRLQEDEIDEYIARNFKFIFWIKGIEACSLLQAIWYFADYLHLNSYIRDKDRREVQSSCSRLFPQVKSAVAPSDPAPRLIGTFPEMIDSIRNKKNASLD